MPNRAHIIIFKIQIIDNFSPVMAAISDFRKISNKYVATVQKKNNYFVFTLHVTHTYMQQQQFLIFPQN